MDHQRCTGRGPAAGGCDGGELCLYHAGRLPGCCRAVRRPGAGDQRLLLAGAVAGRQAGQGVCQPCHPHGAEAGHPVHGAPGHYSAGLGQLHHSDHPDRGRQCGVCRQRERIPELPLPGQRRIQGRNDPLARAQGRHGHPVRGRQHRCPAQKSGAGAPRKAHRLVPVFLPVHPAGQRGHRVLRRAGGAGRHRGCAHLRNDRRHRPHRGDRPWQCAVRARRRRLACLHPGCLQCVLWRACGERYRERRDAHPHPRRAAQGLWHRGGGPGTGSHRCRQCRVPQCGLGPVRGPRARKAVVRRFREPGGKLHDTGGLRTGKGDERPAGQPLQFHQALYHPRRALPCPGQRRGGAGPEPCPHRQHGGH